MRQFDEMLRRGLMAANLTQYETVLERVPDWEPEFSPRYLRERMRLLADPWSWVKRRERPAWKRAARNIACVLLACTLALGSLMAVSPTVRASVFGWLRTITRDMTYYEGPSGNFRVYQEQPGWRPTWIPGGFRFSGVSVTGGTDRTFPKYPGGWQYRLYYTGDKSGASPDTPYFEFICNHSRGSHIGLGLPDETLFQSAQVWGREADFYDEGGGHTRLIWNGPGGELFQLNGSFVNRETLERIADSVQELDAAPMPEYRPGWLPEGAQKEERTTSIMNEVAAVDFVSKDLSTGTILYAAKSVGPLYIPEGTPEAVEVNGIPARFFPAPEMDDGVMGAATTTDHETGETRLVSRLVPSRYKNSLMWTDPETEISFLVQATSLLPREDLMKIAENLTETPR